MNKKEKDLVLILALVLSVALWVATMYYAISRPTNQVAQTSFENITEVANISEPVDVVITKEDIERRKESRAYTDKIVDSLVKELDYSYVYDNFDEQIKLEYFDKNKEKAAKTLKDFIGFNGKASEHYISKQSISSTKDSFINYYIVSYKDKNNKISSVGLEVFVKFTNNKFSLFGFETKPI